MSPATSANFEVVLVNDGSPDTEALEQAIRSYGERLIYIRQQNWGPSGARNTAIRTACGKYIACLDSDNLYLPDHLATAGSSKNRARWGGSPPDAGSAE